MSLAFREHAAKQFEPAPPKWASPHDVGAALNPKFRRTRALEITDDVIIETLNASGGRLIVSTPRKRARVPWR